MKHLLTTSILTVSAIGLLGACSQASVEAATEKTQEVATKSMAAAETAMKPNELIGSVPSGTYKSESGHAYIAFTYSHQGYSKPIIRFNTFDATLELDNENPANSTLSVNIDPASVDTNVTKFDDHLKSADFFDVATYPNIAFTSTSMTQSSGDTGKVTGDLTMHGVTKPLTLDVTLNKAGKTRSGNPKFGISATANLKRSDWGMDTYAPMADDQTIMIEVEFDKAE